MPDDLLTLAPVPQLIKRSRAELAADFDFSRPMRVSRAPGRLDVMGGIADYTGSLVCEATLDRAAAVLLQARDDRQIQVFSFNLFDEHQPFTLRVPLDSLVDTTYEKLRAEFSEPGRRWAGYLVGCLFALHDDKFIDLRDPNLKGVNIALLSDVPLGAGVSSSAAIETATMINLVDHFKIPRHDPTDHNSETAPDNAIAPMRIAALCQRVENKIVGAPCGIMDQVSSCYARSGSLLRLLCQPHEIKGAVKLPPGIRAVGINSCVKHSVGGGMYGRTRCAAFMAHRIIVEKMKQIGFAAGATMTADPMNGYLANLDPDDYKKLFRPYLPDALKGGEFLLQYGGTVDTATRVEPDTAYHVQHAADHHVLESMRVKNFVKFLDQAAEMKVGSPERKTVLDKAGHLMYASHVSYTNDAMLGADECDLLVELVRQRESAGLYGAKITGGGSGGTVAVLADDGSSVDAAIAEIMLEYQAQTGRAPEAFMGTSPGAWHVGTREI